MQQMQVVSLNVGRAETISFGTKSMTTGIRKRPVDGRAYVSAQGVGDDAVVDTDHHGGPDQAVYAYSQDDYEWWEQQLGTAIAPGTFGENLTIRGMPADMNVGDRLLIGDVLLEATAPRIPCNTLATQMRDKGFGTKFRRAERPGIYFRVLNEGEIAAGDSVTFVENQEGTVSISDLVRFYYDLSPGREELERLLQAAIAERFRTKVEAKLAATSV